MKSEKSALHLTDFSIDIIFTVIFTLCLWANVNIENRGWRIVVLLFCMGVICISKFFLLKNYQNHKDNTMIIVFMTTFIELGVFLNVDILGFETDRTFWDVADYVAGITGILPVTLCIVGTQYFLTPSRNQKSTIVAVLFILASMVWVFGVPTKTDEISTRLLKAVTEIAFISAFTIFFDGKSKNNGTAPRFFVDSLNFRNIGAIIVGIFLCCGGAYITKNHTSFRNAILEVMKVLILLAFAIIFRQGTLDTIKEKISPKGKKMIRNLLITFGCFLVVLALVALIAMSTSNLGTAFILILFIGFLAYVTYCFLCKKYKALQRLFASLGVLAVIGVFDIVVAGVTREFGTILILNAYMFIFLCVMYSFMDKHKEEKRFLKVFILCFAVGFVVLLIGLYLLSRNT